MLPFPHFESAIMQRRTLAKGKALFEIGSSIGTEMLSGNTFEVRFPSDDAPEEEIKVVIQIQDGWVSFFSCPCDCATGPMCEHAVAALYEIRKQNTYNNGGDTEEKMRVSRGSKAQYQVLGKEKNPKKDRKKRKEQTKEVEDDLFEEEEFEEGLDEATLTERELECQICLNVVKKPVLLSCQAHSVCFACLESLYKHKKKGRDGKKEVHCPTCGIKSGTLKIKNISDLKVNKGLYQLKTLYREDKKSWEDEKLKLQIEIAEMKALKEKEQERLKNKENENQEKEETLSQETRDTELLKEGKNSIEKDEQTPKKNVFTEEVKENDEDKERKIVAKKNVKEKEEEKNEKELDGKMEIEDELVKNKVEDKWENQRKTRGMKRKEFFPVEVPMENDPNKRVLKKLKM